MAETRLARELETRSSVERPKAWMPASALPEPDKQPGYAYRWIRVASMGQADPKNTSSKMREGWEPVMLEEQPQFQLTPIVDSKTTLRSPDCYFAKSLLNSWISVRRTTPRLLGTIWML